MIRTLPNDIYELTVCCGVRTTRLVLKRHRMSTILFNYNENRAEKLQKLR